MPKDLAHLMIRKIDEAYIEFIQNGSDANAHVELSEYTYGSDANAHVELSEYTLKSKLPQVQHLNRTLRGLIFQSSFNCCSLLECLYSKIHASNATSLWCRTKTYCSTN